MQIDPDADGDQENAERETGQRRSDRLDFRMVVGLGNRMPAMSAPRIGDKPTARVTRLARMTVSKLMARKVRDFWFGGLGEQAA